MFTLWWSPSPLFLPLFPAPTFLTDVEPLHLTPVPACEAPRQLCVFVDLKLERGSNLPLRQGEREAYWCFSYKSTSRKPRQRCCTASQRISDGATPSGRVERRGEKVKKKWCDRRKALNKRRWMIEGYKCACVQTLLLCVLTWKRTREGTEKENDTGRQGCKSKTRTRGRTEREVVALCGCAGC